MWDSRDETSQYISLTDDGSLVVQIQALSPEYVACQLQESAETSPLTGCPEGTLYVSPTDSRANFQSVQAAIDSLPQTGDAVILIGEGEYLKGSMLGDGQLDPSTAYDSAGNASQRNIVHIWDDLYVKPGVSDPDTATLIISPSSGESFGNTDFRAYNIDFENRAANYAISQALVTAISYANASFYGCTFASYQDTWLTSSGAYTYVVDSIIYGQADCKLRSLGTASNFWNSWFQNVILANRVSGGITAWQGTSGTKNGAYIADSQIIRSPDANATTAIAGCYLGRPWNDLAITVYLNTYMDESVLPEGFIPWSGGSSIPDTTFYAEFNSSGPGGSTSARVAQDHILTSEQASSFTLEEVFDGIPAWIDFNYQA
ncbi:carbohydrate esterase family 8 protein [Suillus spraguei]|nr:carbohydrate esterase family 8 protein [Suillus spraguei]